MKMLLESGRVEFVLVDKDGTSYGTLIFEINRGMLKSDLQVEVDDDWTIPLVPRVVNYSAKQLLLDGIDYKRAIDEKAKAIGYNQRKALY